MVKHLIKIGITVGFTVYSVSIKRRIGILNKCVKYYKNLAFIDTLTLLPNRTAFDREMRRIETNPQAYHSLTCLIFDLNYLKITNDTFGHLAGDELIRGSGQCIQKTFGGLGSLFRLGGDEFAVVLMDLTEDEVSASVNELSENIAEYNDTHQYKIDISWGIAREDEEPNIRRLLKKADEKMYENKMKTKKLQ